MPLDVDYLTDAVTRTRLYKVADFTDAVTRTRSFKAANEFVRSATGGSEFTGKTGYRSMGDTASGSSVSWSNYSVDSLSLDGGECMRDIYWDWAELPEPCSPIGGGRQLPPAISNHGNDSYVVDSNQTSLLIKSEPSPYSSKMFNASTNPFSEQLYKSRRKSSGIKKNSTYLTKFSGKIKKEQQLTKVSQLMRNLSLTKAARARTAESQTTPFKVKITETSQRTSNSKNQKMSSSKSVRSTRTTRTARTSTTKASTKIKTSEVLQKKVNTQEPNKMPHARTSRPGSPHKPVMSAMDATIGPLRAWRQPRKGSRLEVRGKKD